MNPQLRLLNNRPVLDGNTIRAGRLRPSDASHTLISLGGYSSTCRDSANTVAFGISTVR